MNTPSILVVDDEPNNFDVIETFLNEQDYILHYAAGGQEALDSLNIFLPDVILLDVMMPGLDGIEVCRRIKAMPQWHPVPIIMVTALTSKEDLARCIEAGADDFISKPVNSLELRARVKSMLRIKQQYDRINTLYSLQENTIDVLQNNLDELCGNLAYTLPHELNTPLNGIFGVVGLLVEDYEEMSSEEIHELLVIAQKSLQRLEKLTKRFFQYAQLEMFSNNPKTAEVRNTLPAKISTQTIIKNTTKNKAESVDRTGDLVWDIADLEVCIAEKDLVFIVDELLENAFKFSHAGTPVQILTQLKEGEFHLIVADQGRGMTPDQISKMGAFIKFDLKDYQQQGIGLGLKIVKRLVENNGGKFLISSVYKQETTVHITLPGC
jgi:two-component system sensor histidine kinase/response regulator